MSAVNHTTLWPAARPMRRPTPIRLNVLDMSAARCGGEFIHQRTMPAACADGRRKRIHPIVSPTVLAFICMHRRVRRCLPLPLGPWASVRRDIIAELCDRAAWLRRPSTTRRGRPGVPRGGVVPPGPGVGGGAAGGGGGGAGGPPGRAAPAGTGRGTESGVGGTGEP